MPALSRVLDRLHHIDGVDRRAFLHATASLAFVPWGAATVAGAARQPPSFPADPFQLGVASGEPTSTGVVLWTRLAPKPLEGGGMPPVNVEVNWQVAHDEGMKHIAQQGTAIATPQLGHSVHAEVDGLEPDRWYWYRFQVGDAVSPVGRTRTFPKRQALPDKLRFALASCQHFETGLYTAYQHMAQEDLDLVIHLGDYIYEKGGRDDKTRKHVGPEITTIDDYRNRHAQYKSDEHLRAAHARFPWLVTWDDHEFDNNYAGRISEEADVVVAEFLARRANAYQVYYEHMPLRRPTFPRGPDMKLYRGVPFGRLAQFSMLDTRQYRSDQANDDGLKPLTGDALNPKATMLGEQQEKWLMASLLQSPAEWNVLAQQVMMTPVKFARDDRAGYPMDMWAGYDVPRRRLMSFLGERRILNPVVLTGDVHKNFVGDLKVDYGDAAAATVATEIVGTSISSDGDSEQKPDYADRLLADNPHVKFFNGERGYVRCTVTPDEWRSDFQVVEYITRAGAPLSTRATFVVEHGQPGAKPA